jgi:hypothetical protein
MSHPEWWLIVFIVLIAEWAFAAFAIKHATCIGYVLYGLMALQLWPAIYIATASEHVNCADCGGVNFGPLVVLSFAFWISTIVLLACFIGLLLVISFHGTGNAELARLFGADSDNASLPSPPNESA